MAAVDSNGYISRGNMTVILSAAGLVMIAFGGFISFQNSATSGRIDELRQSFEKTISRGEHDEFKLRLDKDIRRIDEAILRARADVVPRNENEAHWKVVDDQTKMLSDRLNQLRTETGSFVTVRDEIARLHTQIDDMRKVIAERPPK